MMISVQLYPISEAIGLDGASIALKSLDPAKDQDRVESLDILGSIPPQTPQGKRLLEKGSSRVCLSKAVQSLSKKLTITEILENLEKDERGKPFFRDLPFDLSLAHSRGVVVAAVTEKRNGHFLGIDLEVRPPHDVDALRRVCTQNEWTDIQSIENIEERKASFLRRWCAKEAYVKALGEGLGYGFVNLDVEPTRIPHDQGAQTTRIPELWRLIDQTSVPPPSTPIYTWCFESQDTGPSCLSITYPRMSKSKRLIDGSGAQGLEFLVNDGKGFPDF
jgi:phosphopantetheinyl transferase